MASLSLQILNFLRGAVNFNRKSPESTSPAALKSSASILDNVVVNSGGSISKRPPFQFDTQRVTIDPVTKKEIITTDWGNGNLDDNYIHWKKDSSSGGWLSVSNWLGVGGYGYDDTPAKYDRHSSQETLVYFDDGTEIHDDYTSVYENGVRKQYPTLYLQSTRDEGSEEPRNVYLYPQAEIDSENMIIPLGIYRESWEGGTITEEQEGGYVVRQPQYIDANTKEWRFRFVVPYYMKIDTSKGFIEDNLGYGNGIVSNAIVFHAMMHADDLVRGVVDGQKWSYQDSQTFNVDDESVGSWGYYEMKMSPSDFKIELFEGDIVDFIPRSHTLGVDVHYGGDINSLIYDCFFADNNRNVVDLGSFGADTLSGYTYSSKAILRGVTGLADGVMRRVQGSIPVTAGKVHRGQYYKNVRTSKTLPFYDGQTECQITFEDESNTYYFISNTGKLLVGSVGLVESNYANRVEKAFVIVEEDIKKSMKPQTPDLSVRNVQFSGVDNDKTSVNGNILHLHSEDRSLVLSGVVPNPDDTGTPPVFYSGNKIYNVYGGVASIIQSTDDGIPLDRIAESSGVFSVIAVVESPFPPILDKNAFGLLFNYKEIKTLMETTRFFQNRLWVVADEQYVIGSHLGNITQFSNDLGTDAEAVYTKFLQSRILHFIDAGYLTVFTEDGVYACKAATNQQTLTNATIGFTKISTEIISADIPPVYVGGFCFFIDATRTSLYSVDYQFIDRNVPSVLLSGDFAHPLKDVSLLVGLDYCPMTNTPALFIKQPDGLSFYSVIKTRDGVSLAQSRFSVKGLIDTMKDYNWLKSAYYISKFAHLKFNVQGSDQERSQLLTLMDFSLPAERKESIYVDFLFNPVDTRNAYWMRQDKPPFIPFDIGDFLNLLSDLSSRNPEKNEGSIVKLDDNVRYDLKKRVPTWLEPNIEGYEEVWYPQYQDKYDQGEIIFDPPVEWHYFFSEIEAKVQTLYLPSAKLSAKNTIPSISTRKSPKAVVVSFYASESYDLKIVVGGTNLYSDDDIQYKNDTDAGKYNVNLSSYAEGRYDFTVDSYKKDENSATKYSGTVRTAVRGVGKRVMVCVDNSDIKSGFNISSIIVEYNIT